ncbi:hypothetical protein [Amycolatopsis thermoflava]|uniref:hypothetical protein n=1 Tax=Amycolatopsis thermoflava TaxID=84480 RepID=UPI003EBEB713
MAFTKSKAKTLASYAIEAKEQGRTVLVVQMRAPLHMTGNFSRPIPDMAEMIEAVESEGWAMDKATFSDEGRTVTGYFIFRR